MPKKHKLKKSVIEAGFEAESHYLHQTESLLENSELTTGELREALADLCGHYAGLLNHIGKLTRISDANQKRLLRSQQAQRDAEERYRSIYEQSFEGIFQMTLKGQLMDANPAFHAIFGYRSQEDLQRTVNGEACQLFADPGTLNRLLAKAMESGRITAVESQAVRQDGSVFWISQNMHLVTTPDGQPGYFEGSVVDVTERRQAEDTMRQAIHQAQEANHAKTHFLANVTHELRTPLNGILGYAQILRRYEDLPAKVSSGIDTIHDSAEHLLSIISGLLDLTRMESRKLEYKEEPFELPAFFNLLESQFRLRANRKHIDFRLELDSGLPQAWVGDEGKLRQVIFNLLGNAVKFTDEGAVSLLVQRVEADRYTFEVADTGPGISHEDQQRIFRPFEQGESGHRSKTGSGLGLAISRNLVELMGGQLQLKSKIGEGSCFFFTLPLRAASASASLPSGRIRGYGGERQRIMVVDAEVQPREVLRELLQSLGFIVETFSPTRQECEQMSAFAPDISLVARPAGGNVCAECSPAQTTETVFGSVRIALVDDDTPQTRQQVLEEGYSGFLLKPVRERPLLECLGYHLHLKWNTETAPAPTKATNAPAKVPAIPATDLSRLQKLAQLGKVRELKQELDQLALKHGQHHPFIEQATSRAARYDTKGLKELIHKARQKLSAS